MHPNHWLLALGVYLPFSRTMHVVLPWSWPSRGSYLYQGFPAMAWVLHESGLPPTGTRTYGLGATFLCYCSELSRPDVSLGRCLSLGDMLLGRRVTWATSYFGRRLTSVMSRAVDLLTFLPWVPSRDPPCVDFSSLGPLKGPTMC